MLHCRPHIRYVATPGNAMCKFADDTYLIVPACNVDSCVSEIEGIEACAWLRATENGNQHALRAHVVRGNYKAVHVSCIITDIFQ